VTVYYSITELFGAVSWFFSDCLELSDDCNRWRS